MTHNRRDMIGLVAAAITATAVPAAAQATTPRYGLINQMLAKGGKRDELIAILSQATGAMPGCLPYIVALDGANPDAIWITKVWDGR
ncbi:antibiotic biosynthesis monooxygenase family protein [Sphingobium sp.]|uniref:antibiotic biosynthesis monooxygenase family protein n=1 Tax=Sphingobium sp. TaxID=1912891 RepID=UPI003B3B8A93